MKVLTIISQKGGVGKTTTVLALGSKLQEEGKKVLFLDLDPQGNLTECFNVSTESSGTAELLLNQAKIEKLITKTPQGDILAANQGKLSKAINLDVVKTGERLKTTFKELKGYNYVIIDCPPALNSFTVTALLCSDNTLSPIQADAYSKASISRLITTVNQAKEYNPGLKCLGFFLTQYDGRTILSRQCKEDIEKEAKACGSVLLKAYIRNCVALKEAIYTRTSNIYKYAPKSNAVKDYNSLYEEIKKHI